MTKVLHFNKKKAPKYPCYGNTARKKMKAPIILTVRSVGFRIRQSDGGLWRGQLLSQQCSFGFENAYQVVLLLLGFLEAGRTNAPLSVKKRIKNKGRGKIIA